MELVDYLRMLRRQWVWVVGSVVVLTALAAVYVMTAPKTYKATADLFVGSTVLNTPADNQSALSASNYVFDRIDTYATFIDNPKVLADTIKLAKLPSSTSESDLAKQLSASVVPNTVVIAVAATDASPAQAQTTANVAAAALGEYIKTLDIPAAGTAVIVPSISQPANLPAAPDSPNRNLMLALGVLVGLALGLVIASLRDQLRRSRPTRGGQAVEAADEPAPPAPSASRTDVSTPKPPSTTSAFQPPADDVDGTGTTSSSKPVPSASLEAALASTQARTKRPERSEPISVPPADGPSSQR